MYSAQRQRLHPLIAAAAVSVILVSLVGIASLSGFMPASLSPTPASTAAVVPAVAVVPGPRGVVAPVVAAAPTAALPVSAPVNTADTLTPGETLLVESNLPARPIGATVVPPIEKSVDRQGHGAVRRTAPGAASTNVLAASAEPMPRPVPPRRHAARVATSTSGNTGGGQTHAGRGTQLGVMDPTPSAAAPRGVSQYGNASPRIVPVVRPPSPGGSERGGTTGAGLERSRTLGQDIDQTLSRLVDAFSLRTDAPAPQPELSRY